MHLRNFLKSRFHPNYCVALKISCLYINIYSAAKFLSRLVFGRTINFQKLLYAHSIVYNSDLESGEQSFLLAGAPSTWAAGCPICGTIRQLSLRPTAPSTPTVSDAASTPAFQNFCRRAFHRRIQNKKQLGGQTCLFNAYPRPHGAGERYLLQVYALGSGRLGLVQRINQSQQILTQCFRRE